MFTIVPSTSPAERRHVAQTLQTRITTHWRALEQDLAALDVIDRSTFVEIFASMRGALTFLWHERQQTLSLGVQREQTEANR